MSQNNLDTPIYRGMQIGVLSESLKGPVFGCEIELEGSLPAENILPYWKVKGEDSLRNGFEYIFREPLTMAKTIDAVQAFEERMKKYSPVGSIRCSTHIHVNVLDLTIRQVYTVTAVFHLLESLLFDKVPPTRHGNLFCLRMRDAERIFFDLRASLLSQQYFMFPANQHKYSALNLATVWGLGTVEFRFLPALWTEKELMPWFVIFDSIRRFGSSRTLGEILQLYEELPVQQFLKEIFPANAYAFLTEGKTPLALNQLLHTNYDYIYELERTFERKRYRAQEKHWDPDLGSMRPQVSPFSPVEWASQMNQIAADWTEPDSSDFDYPEEPEPMPTASW